MEQQQVIQKNIAETLADVLPKAALLGAVETGVEALHIAHYAVPKGAEVKEVKTDLEALLPNPRRTKATAKFANADSFLAYVQRHAGEGTVTWCDFNPQTYALKFTAVIDEHTKEAAGWRKHCASFEPEMSAEWKAWKGKNAQVFAQVAFAEWIEEHADDITTANGLPTSLQMLAMATEFQANEERALKSTVKLQSGGVRLNYIADPDAGTVESMDMFKQFAIGIPVFHGGSAWSITARLKYRLSGGKVSFFYELVRPDRVHDGAAKELVEVIRSGLGSVPLLMGDCT